MNESIIIKNFISNINSLFNFQNYVARSNYFHIIKEFQNTYLELSTLNTKDILKEYCLKNNLDINEVKQALVLYENIEYFMEHYNKQFINKKLIQEKTYLDNILKDVDPHINLDEDQRKVVLADEDYTLVIAGAGAGKTTTVAAKVKYLVEKEFIDPKEILIISFTNKAVGELQEKINRDLKINCPITTFHATGLAILKKGNTPKIIYEGAMYNIINNYLQNNILNNKKMVNNLLLFFSTYFNSSLNELDLKSFFEKISVPFSTLKNDLNETKENILNIRTKKNITISNEYVRSQDEVTIANFLYLNGIDYQYEPIYKYNINGSKKPYTPDFLLKQGNNICYLEHFGISENGENNRFSAIELELYKQSIKDKILLHQIHGTKLIYTFSKYNDKRPLVKHLEELLIKNGFILQAKHPEEVLKKIITTEESKYITKLVMLICRFIHNFKVMGYTEEEFSKMLISTNNERSRIFLEIARECYLEYQKVLKSNEALDFEDMINESAKLLREAKINKEELGFKYIIVDEYQDISKQRFDLTKALSDICKAKIMVVGDDWQAIYAFSGSDVELFTKFKEKMGYGNIIKIVHTYRNSQELIDIAGDFVTKNKIQIKKDLISPKRLSNPIIIYTYDNMPKFTSSGIRNGKNYNMAKAIEKALDDIIKEAKNSNKNPYLLKILVLCRFNFEGNNLQNSGLFEIHNKDKLKSLKYPYLDLTFMSAHSSKGLGYDNVIVINGKNETYGFPSKIVDDPVLYFVTKRDLGTLYAEERRLFYVALTRTKNKVYFIAPNNNPSEFLLELKNNYQNVVLVGEWNEIITPKKINKCPLCGYPLQFRMSHAYGIPLYICTKEPEICGFMTNDLNGGKLAITKCDKCYDGYLIVKHNRTNDTYFLGCTNYTSNKLGCNNAIFVKNENKENTNKSIIKEEKILAIDKFQDIILECLNEVEFKNLGNYGITTYARILKGSNAQVIRENGLKSISYYGKLNFLKRTQIKDIIEALINKGFIYKDKELLPHIFLTVKGKSMVKNNYSTKKEIYIDKYNLNKTMLDFIKEISKINYFNKETIISVLQGIKTLKVSEYNLHNSPFFGIYKDIKTETLINALNDLLNKDLILETRSVSPTIHVTAKGMNH